MFESGSQCKTFSHHFFLYKTFFILFKTKPPDKNLLWQRIAKERHVISYVKAKVDVMSANLAKYLLIFEESTLLKYCWRLKMLAIIDRDHHWSRFYHKQNSSRSRAHVHVFLSGTVVHLARSNIKWQPKVGPKTVSGQFFFFFEPWDANQSYIPYRTGGTKFGALF